MQRPAVEAVDGNVEDWIHEVFDLFTVLRISTDAVFGAEKCRQIERLGQNIRRVVQIFVNAGRIRDEADAFSFEDVRISFQIVDAVHVIDPVFCQNRKILNLYFAIGIWKNQFSTLNFNTEMSGWREKNDGCETDEQDTDR